MKPRLVATLVTSQALDDFIIFVKTLMLWNSGAYPTLCVFCDTNSATALTALKYPGTVHTNVCLNSYSLLSRETMERIPGVNSKTKWMDFQMEKLNLLAWAFSKEPVLAAESGAFYFDADICFMGPLPEIPDTAEVGLSPHHIRESDQAKFGAYNAGYVWMKSPAAIEAWRKACATSRFFEQSALEVFRDSPAWNGSLYEFPIQHNYGWWRLWQGDKSPSDLLREWGIFRSKGNSGIVVQKEPLGSVHTHWTSKDYATREFNVTVFQYLKRLAGSHPPAAQLLRILTAAAGQI